MEPLKTFIDDHQIYHSNFQMDFLITGKNGATDYGMYKQCLRELFKRYRGIKQLYCHREKLKIDIDEHEYKSTHEENEFKRRRAEVDLIECKLGEEDLDKNISDTEREFIRFSAQADALKKRVGELTDEERDKKDLELWMESFKFELAVEKNNTGRINSNMLQTLKAIPVTLRQELFAFLADSGQMHQCLNAPTSPMPVIETDSIDLNKLLEDTHATSTIGQLSDSSREAE